MSLLSENVATVVQGNQVITENWIVDSITAQAADIGVVVTDDLTVNGTMTCNLPDVIPVSNDPTGLVLNSPGVKTYPPTGPTSWFSYPGINASIEVGTDQTITTGTNNVIVQSINSTKSAGTTSDIERLYFTNWQSRFNWTDANTCKQFVAINNNFNYYGANANGRTSSLFQGINSTCTLSCPSGGAQTIANVSSSNVNIIGNSNSTYTITNINSNTSAINFRSANAMVAPSNANITNVYFYNATWSSAWNVALSQANIQNVYGLRLRAPTSTTNLTVTNKWGVYQEYATAKNYFAGNVAIGTNSPSPSAALQVDSTTQGFLLPRMTGAQAIAISTPAQGLMVFATSTSGAITSTGWWGWNGSAWVKLG